MGRPTDQLPYICLLFSGFSNVYHFSCVWPTALKLGCMTNFDTLFLVMGFISLVDEIQFMLISNRQICIRSIIIVCFVFTSCITINCEFSDIQDGDATSNLAGELLGQMEAIAASLFSIRCNFYHLCWNSLTETASSGPQTTQNSLLRGFAHRRGDYNCRRPAQISPILP